MTTRRDHTRRSHTGDLSRENHLCPEPFLEPDTLDKEPT